MKGDSSVRCTSLEDPRFEPVVTQVGLINDSAQEVDTIRKGMHDQQPHTHTKLIRCIFASTESTYVDESCMYVSICKQFLPSR